VKIGVFQFLLTVVETFPTLLTASNPAGVGTVVRVDETPLWVTEVVVVRVLVLFTVPAVVVLMTTEELVEVLMTGVTVVVPTVFTVLFPAEVVDRAAVVPETVALTVVLFAEDAAEVVWAAAADAAEEETVVCVFSAEFTESVVLLAGALLTHPATSRTQASNAIVPMSNEFLDIDDVPVHFSAGQFS
jgi:hypothetical protein